MDAREAIYIVKCIIAYGATPKTVEPIGKDEIRAKARADGIEDQQTDIILTVLEATKEIDKLPQDKYRLTTKGANDDD